MEHISNLVNNGKVSVVHIKSGEGATGFKDDKHMAQWMYDTYKTFQDDKTDNSFRSVFSDIQKEYCIIAPIIQIESVITELEDIVNGRGE